MQAVLPGATRTEIWERSGKDVDALLPGKVMDAGEMVDAALLGLDRGEVVTIPPLADETLYETANAAEVRLGAPSLGAGSCAALPFGGVMRSRLRADAEPRPRGQAAKTVVRFGREGESAWQPPRSRSATSRSIASWSRRRRFSTPWTFLPTLTKEVLEENRGWMTDGGYLDRQNGELVLCIQSYLIQTKHHNILIDSCVGNHQAAPDTAVLGYDEHRSV